MKIIINFSFFIEVNPLECLWSCGIFWYFSVNSLWCHFSFFFLFFLTLVSTNVLLMRQCNSNCPTRPNQSFGSLTHHLLMMPYIYIYIWSKVNISNVNCAWAKTFIFDTPTGVLVKVSKFLRQKMYIYTILYTLYWLIMGKIMAPCLRTSIHHLDQSWLKIIGINHIA